MKKNQQSSRSHPRYTDQFREDTARLVVERGHKPVDVARDLNVSTASVSRWVSQFLASRKDSDSSDLPSSAAEVHKENIRIRKENDRLRRQCQILKKALEIFSQEPGNTSNL